MKNLRVSQLNKSFAGTTVLCDVELYVGAGQLAAVLGPSGCGKTTLLRSIAGFERPDSGTIEIGDITVFGSSKELVPEKRRIGYVPQEGALFPHLSVAQNVGFGLPRKLRHSGRVEEMLELTGMADLGRRMPHELSGGQQQRVALARALAPSPSLVLLDEPFSALDAGLRASLREDVRAALKQAGTTAILVTHDQEEALSIADTVAVMRSGQVIQTADPATLYQFPVDLGVATFVGDTTLLPAKVEGNHAHCALGELPVQSGIIPIKSGAAVLPDSGGLVDSTVMVRPEQIVIGSPDEGVTAQVAEVTYFGHDALVRLHLANHTPGIDVTARVSGFAVYTPGDIVGLRIAGKVMVYDNSASKTAAQTHDK